MECKEQIIYPYQFAKNIGIYPEWNVKIASFITAYAREYNWNISRMECKVIYISIISL